jgi:hypothetical protein
MVQQVASLGKTYTEWVHKPVDRPLRLFDSFWLEILSKTPWWLVPAFWVPIISFLVLSNVQSTYQVFEKDHNDSKDYDEQSSLIFCVRPFTSFWAYACGQFLSIPCIGGCFTLAQKAVTHL